MIQCKLSIIVLGSIAIAADEGEYDDSVDHLTPDERPPRRKKGEETHTDADRERHRKWSG